MSKNVSPLHSSSTRECQKADLSTAKSLVQTCPPHFYSFTLITLLKYLSTVSSFSPFTRDKLLSLIKMLKCLSVISVHSQQLSFRGVASYLRTLCPGFHLSGNIHDAMSSWWRLFGLSAAWEEDGIFLSHNRLNWGRVTTIRPAN